MPRETRALETIQLSPDDHFIEGLWGTLAEQGDEAFYDDRSDADDDLEKGRLKFPQMRVLVNGTTSGVVGGSKVQNPDMYGSLGPFAYDNTSTPNGERQSLDRSSHAKGHLQGVGMVGVSIYDKLYGREKELRTLKKIYVRAAATSAARAAKRQSGQSISNSSLRSSGGGRAQRIRGPSSIEAQPEAFETTKVIFLTGFRGVGKTALLQEFLRRVQEDELTASLRMSAMGGMGGLGGSIGSSGGRIGSLSSSFNGGGMGGRAGGGGATKMEESIVLCASGSCNPDSYPDIVGNPEHLQSSRNYDLDSSQKSKASSLGLPDLSIVVNDANFESECEKAGPVKTSQLSDRRSNLSSTRGSAISNRGSAMSTRSTMTNDTAFYSTVSTQSQLKEISVEKKPPISRNNDKGNKKCSSMTSATTATTLTESVIEGLGKGSTFDGVPSTIAGLAIGVVDSSLVEESIAVASNDELSMGEIDLGTVNVSTFPTARDICDAKEELMSNSKIPPLALFTEAFYDLVSRLLPYLDDRVRNVDNVAENEKKEGDGKSNSNGKDDASTSSGSTICSSNSKFSNFSNYDDDSSTSSCYSSNSSSDSSSDDDACGFYTSYANSSKKKKELRKKLKSGKSRPTRRASNSKPKQSTREEVMRLICSNIRKGIDESSIIGAETEGKSVLLDFFPVLRPLFEEKGKVVEPQSPATPQTPTSPVEVQTNQVSPSINNVREVKNHMPIIQSSTRELLSLLSSAVYKPFVLSMDDLQNADEYSLELLQFLMVDEKLENIVFICSFSSDEVGVGSDGIVRSNNDNQSANDDEEGENLEVRESMTKIPLQKFLESVVYARGGNPGPMASSTTSDAATTTTSSNDPPQEPPARRPNRYRPYGPQSSNNTNKINSIEIVDLFLFLPFEPLLKFISDTLHKEPTDVQPFLQQLYPPTMGNITLVKKAMDVLVKKNVLYYDMMYFEWCFVLEKVQGVLCRGSDGKDWHGSCNDSELEEKVVRVVRRKLKEMPPDLTQLLFVLATFPMKGDPSLLRDVLTLEGGLDETKSLEESDLKQLLKQASLEGLLTMNKDSGYYEFVHGHVRSACSMIWKRERREDLFLRVLTWRIQKRNQRLICHDDDNRNIKSGQTRRQPRQQQQHEFDEDKQQSKIRQDIFEKDYVPQIWEKKEMSALVDLLHIVDPTLSESNSVTKDGTNDVEGRHSRAGSNRRHSLTSQTRAQSDPLISNEEDQKVNQKKGGGRLVGMFNRSMEPVKLVGMDLLNRKKSMNVEEFLEDGNKDGETDAGSVASSMYLKGLHDSITCGGVNHDILEKVGGEKDSKNQRLVGNEEEDDDSSSKLVRQSKFLARKASTISTKFFGRRRSSIDSISEESGVSDFFGEKERHERRGSKNLIPEKVNFVSMLPSIKPTSNATKMVADESRGTAPHQNQVSSFSGSAKADTDTLNHLFFPCASGPSSILLKHGSVFLYESTNKSLNPHDITLDYSPENLCKGIYKRERELMLFNHGFIVADVALRDCFRLFLALQDKDFLNEASLLEYFRVKFRKIDVNGDGELNKWEIVQILNDIGMPMSESILRDPTINTNENESSNVSVEKLQRKLECLVNPPGEKTEFDTGRRISRRSSTGSLERDQSEILDYVKHTHTKQSQVECAALFSSVVHVDSLNVCHGGDSASKEVYHSCQAQTSFSVSLSGLENRPLIFVCSKPEYRDSWVAAFRPCVIQAWENSSDPIIIDVRNKLLGWQHLAIRSTYSSLVILDDVETLEHLLHQDIKTGKRYLKNMLEINKLDEYNGYSPVHYASILGRAKCLQVLLQSGAEGDLEDRDGLVPMNHALSHKHTDVVKILENFGVRSSIELVDSTRNLVGVEDLLRKVSTQFGYQSRACNLRKGLYQEKTNAIPDRRVRKAKSFHRAESADVDELIEGAADQVGSKLGSSLTIGTHKSNLVRANNSRSLISSSKEDFGSSSGDKTENIDDVLLEVASKFGKGRSVFNSSCI